MADPSFLSSEQYSEYRQRLAESLNSMRVPEAKITEILAYSDILQQHQVPIIFDQPHLAGLLGYDLDYVQVLSTCKEDFYKEYRIPKSTGFALFLRALNSGGFLCPFASNSQHSSYANLKQAPATSLYRSLPLKRASNNLVYPILLQNAARQDGSCWL